jgi:hypothetical protein
MVKNEDPKHDADEREIAMAARATVELFGNGAIAKTRERLLEVEADGSEESVQYWRRLLTAVERLHELRQRF